jgi:hypothetical protein
LLASSVTDDAESPTLVVVADAALTPLSVVVPWTARPLAFAVTCVPEESE